MGNHCHKKEIYNNDVDIKNDINSSISSYLS